MALMFCDRLRAELNEMPQNVGATFPGVHRKRGVDGSGKIVGLGEEMTLTGGRHLASVSPDDLGVTPLPHPVAAPRR